MEFPRHIPAVHVKQNTNINTAYKYQHVYQIQNTNINMYTKKKTESWRVVSL